MPGATEIVAQLEAEAAQAASAAQNAEAAAIAAVAASEILNDELTRKAATELNAIVETVNENEDDVKWLKKQNQELSTKVEMLAATCETMLSILQSLKPSPESKQPTQEPENQNVADPTAAVQKQVQETPQQNKVPEKRHKML